MARRHSRLKKGVVFKRLALFLAIGLTSLLLFIFLGLPLLAKLSLFFGKIKGEGEENLIVDQTPPFPPQIEVPFSATSSARITLEGRAEPNSTIKFFLNNQDKEEILVGKEGSFSKRINLQKGENKIQAQSIDQAGNRSGLSLPIFITYKQEAPDLIVEFPPEELEAKEEEIEIKGKTESGATLTINNRFVLVKNDGSFNHLFTLSEGENLIKIIAVDQAGNQTKKEIKVTFSPEKDLE